ncbi:hypothetical protein FHX37_1485 [Haloactinospora alba]|uniref:Uncharacterized protein n=1 Tax=Haloactinospora alba TaxID=405555 RepID=A0A543NIB0_9ACTN|nr:hypothetical protein FHX37_1485 [Haloactinospora alba]
MAATAGAAMVFRWATPYGSRSNGYAPGRAVHPGGNTRCPDCDSPLPGASRRQQDAG